MSKIETNIIAPSTGTILTLGENGNTVALGSNASQTIAVNTPSFSANRLTGSITASVSTWTKAVFNNKLYDTDNAYDTSNGRFTVPSGEAGKYHFSTCFYSFESTANNNISAWYTAFYKNGSLEVFTTTGGGDRVGNGRAHVLSATLDLAVGDYIELYFRTNCGSGNIGYEVGHTYNRFIGHKLIG